MSPRPSLARKYIKPFCGLFGFFCLFCLILLHIRHGTSSFLFSASSRCVALPISTFLWPFLPFLPYSPPHKATSRFLFQPRRVALRCPHQSTKRPTYLPIWYLTYDRWTWPIGVQVQVQVQAFRGSRLEEGFASSAQPCPALFNLPFWPQGAFPSIGPTCTGHTAGTYSTKY